MSIHLSQPSASGAFLSQNTLRGEAFMRVVSALVGLMFFMIMALSVSAQTPAPVPAPEQEKPVTRPAPRYDDTDLTAAAQTSNADTQSASLVQKGIQVAIIANVFRLEAYKNVRDAVNRWGTVNFVARWNQDISLVFEAPGRQPMLREFFATAIIFVGSIQDDDAVVGLYNPWHDGVLLMHLMAKEDSFVIADFRFIPGETWRNEKAATADDLLRLYALKEPLVLALARNYAATAETFAALYLPEGTQGFLPKPLADRLDIPDDELKPILARMLYRTRMFTALVAPPNRPALAALKTLAARVRDGDEAALLAALAPSQNLDMVTSICQLPADARAEFGPAYFGEGDGAIIALTSPLHPRWVIAAQVSQGETDGTVVRVELFDLESSEALLKLTGGRKP